MAMNFKLPLIPGDKANHYIYGLLIFALCYIVVGALISSIISIIVAGSKEVYDHYNPGHAASWADIIWTLLGSATAAILIFWF
jgi:VanZ family protein